MGGKSVNEDIYHMGQYLTNKKVFSEFKRSTDTQAFSRKYEKELTSYEEAVAAIKVNIGIDHSQY